MVSYVLVARNRLVDFLCMTHQVLKVCSRSSVKIRDITDIENVNKLVCDQSLIFKTRK